MNDSEKKVNFYILIHSYCVYFEYYFYLKKMAQFSFESLLKTTKKGIPETYTETTSLSQEFYSMSLGLEIIFMLLFISYFGMALFRAFKKIKNPKFKASEEPESE